MEQITTFSEIYDLFKKVKTLCVKIQSKLQPFAENCNYLKKSRRKKHLSEYTITSPRTTPHHEYRSDRVVKKSLPPSEGCPWCSQTA